MDQNQAEKNFARLAFPDSLVRIHRGEYDPFDFALRDPYHVFRSGAPLLPNTLVPLFESGPYTYFYDELEKCFVAFHLESPRDRSRFGASIQCLWAGILLNRFDDETTLDEVQRIAEGVGFTNADFLFETMQLNLAGQLEYSAATEEIMRHCETTSRLPW